MAAEPIPAARQASKIVGTTGVSSPAHAGSFAYRQEVVRTPWVDGRHPVSKEQNPGSVEEGRSVVPPLEARPPR